jgi:UDP-glucuronate 4-epimerase
LHIFITGIAGFIGSTAAHMLLDQGHQVSGIDNLNDYYDPSLKQARLDRLMARDGFSFTNAGIEERGVLMGLFEQGFDAVIHLAAQAGVRYSIDNPRAYLEANLIGTFELLEAARAYPPKHMLLASTSSAYGANTEMPYSETQKADHQMSFYAATKKSNEAMAHSYAHLFDLPITCFRFFTVYGPWGRPDMALFKFVDAIQNGRPIDVYNHGHMKLDFSYVTDLVRALTMLIETPPITGNPVGDFDSLSPVAPYRVVNIGNNDPVELGDFIAAIEGAMGQEATKNYMDMQAGDVPATWADTTLLQALTQYKPTTNVKTGVAAFVAWYQDYYRATESEKNT